MRPHFLTATVTGLLASLMAAAGAAHAATACGRTCLEGFVDQYLDAVLAHDPARLPLAPDVKFTENGQKLQPGDGLWRTLTARGTYDRRYVSVDPERGLVLSFAFFDHSAGDTRTFQTPAGRTVTAGPAQPWTWELAEAFRIENGKIHQIMAIMERVPYGMNSGWSSWEDGLSSKARDVTK